MIIWKILESEFSYLQKLCLVTFIIFHKRCGEEALKIKIVLWINSNKWKRKKDIENIEDPMERLLEERLKIIYSKGKKKKRLQTLFTTESDKAISYLMTNQDNVGRLTNMYFFTCVTRNSKNRIHGWEVVHDQN